MKKKEKSKLSGLVAFHEVDVSSRFNDVYEDFRPDKLQDWQQKDSTFFFFARNGITLRVQVLTTEIIRVTYKTRNPWEADASYAIDPDFQPNVPESLIAIEHQDYVEISTPRLRCRVNKKRLKVDFLNHDNQLLLADGRGFGARSTILTGMSNLWVDKKLDKKTSFYGLGDKSGSLKLNGRYLENWNTDAFAYGNETDPLYKTIPFTVGHRKGNWFGLFFDNTYRTYFDFGKTKKKNLRIGAKGGEANYYFMHGADSTEVARLYAQLTGRPELPALWMLGFHQCRWSYYPESRVREIADEFRKRQIPCDALYLDIDYMDGYRCFTWNTNHFPAPKKMMDDLKDKGFRTVVMIDPGLKVDPEYEVYREGLENDYYCRRTDGELMIGPVWPDNCVFPDFTRKEVREWWGKQYKKLYSEQGVAGFWNDMNEPAVFKVLHKTFPENVIHEWNGRATDHRRAHNIYGQQMVRATYDGLKDLESEKRPLVITRATYAGGQRYSFAWTGDNIASWEHLKLASIQCQRMSLSGFSLIGSDIGGFVEKPTPELMVRWVQLAVFHPFFRIHSMGNNVDGAAGANAEAIKKEEIVNRLDQEPWSFGSKAENRIRAAIELRYRLLPYIYTLCKQLAEDGTPVLRSLALSDPDNSRLQKEEAAFFVGEDLLVYPVCEPGLKKMKVTMPAGTWYDYHTGNAHSGPKVSLDIKKDHIPIFLRAGGLVPHYPVRQWVDEKPPEELLIKTAHKIGKSTSRLYEDTGEGYQYKNGEFVWRTFEMEGSATYWQITQQRHGNFEEPYQMCQIQLFGLPFEPEQASVDGLTVGFSWDEKRKVLAIECPSQFNQIKVGE